MISKPIIAANWKMHKTPQEGYQFARKLTTKALNIQGVKFILCAPYTGLFYMSDTLKGTGISLGGQNLHWASHGAYTGEISASMLKASGCEWVIVGHSERRHIFLEDNTTVRKKLNAAYEAQLKIILCIGETLEEREAGETRKVLAEQLSENLSDSAQFPVNDIIIAYEPVWAIGTGVVATTQQVEEAHRDVRQIMGDMYPAIDRRNLVVLYGGSVKTENAANLIKVAGVDGFLIGGASLDLEEYTGIAEISQASKKTEENTH